MGLRHLTKWINDSKGQGVWPFTSSPDEDSYNEGDLIATSADPVWSTKRTGDPVTPIHEPCGYWTKGPPVSIPPSPLPPGGKMYVTGRIFDHKDPARDAYVVFTSAADGRLYTLISRTYASSYSGFLPGTIMAIDGDEKLWVYGENNYGQLGVGGTGDKYANFVQAGSAEDWKKVATGYDHSLGVRGEIGQLWSCGRNRYGALGLGDTNDRHTWTLVPGMTGIVDVAVSNEEFSAVVKADGTLWVCGKNSYGALGLYNNNESQQYHTFQHVTQETNAAGGKVPSTNWVKCCSGKQCIYAIKVDGSLWAAGNSVNGFEISHYDPAYARDGSVVRYFQPADGGHNLGIVSIDANGEFQAGMVSADGEVWSIGYGTFYTFGHGTGSWSTWQKPPLPAGADKIVKIREGFYHSILLSENGKIYVAGTEASGIANGCLGDGDPSTSQSNVYKEIALPFPVAEVGCSAGFTILIKG